MPLFGKFKNHLIEGISMQEIGIIIVGDEILSGKREDKHLMHMIETLKKRNLSIDWVRILPDDLNILVSHFQQSFQSRAIVFCFGGIGATPDDMTRQAVAKANQVQIEQHPDAKAEIEAKFGEAAYPDRIILANLPQKSRIIPNSYNRIPGFSLDKHHFFPGFPMMAWPMVDWVLEHEYPDLKQDVVTEKSVMIYEISETQLLATMANITKQYPQVKLFSLPHLKEETGGKRLELGVKGNQQDVDNAMLFIENILKENNYKYSY